MARSTASRKSYAMRVCAPRTEASAAMIFSIESQKVTTGEAQNLDSEQELQGIEHDPMAGAVWR